VSHELLKSVFKSLGIFSLAQNNIQAKKIASFLGYSSQITLMRRSLKINIF